MIRLAAIAALLTSCVDDHRDCGTQPQAPALAAHLPGDGTATTTEVQWNAELVWRVAIVTYVTCVESP